MFKHLFFLVVLTCSTWSMASSNGYKCTVINEDQIQILARLKVPHLSKTTGLFTIQKENCNLPVPAPYDDGCAIKGHHILIQLDTMSSIFITSKNQKIPLFCETDGARPSHGGSN